MSGSPKVIRSPATRDDYLALPEDARIELVDGVLVEREAAKFEHSASQRGVALETGSFGRRGGGAHPGGWWIGTEAEVEYDGRHIFLHDLAGWRRERCPERPSGRPVAVRPDWVCEILSPSNWSHDTVTKFNLLQRHGVPHYWVVDLEHGVLTVYRLGGELPQVAALARPGERRRLEPFDALELDVGVLFGDDPLEP